MDHVGNPPPSESWLVLDDVHVFSASFGPNQLFLLLCFDLLSDVDLIIQRNGENLLGKLFMMLNRVFVGHLPAFLIA